MVKLCWLSWKVTHNKFYAKNFHFASLVVLNLSWSNIEDDWGGWSQIQMTKKLKVLDLTGCTKLTRTPDFSNIMGLEILVLAKCVLLTTIDCSIDELELLKTLNIVGCFSLGKLPPKVCSPDSSVQIVRFILVPHRGPKIPCSLELLVLSYVPLPSGVWANLTRLCFHECGGTKALLQRLDNLDCWPNITLEVYPEISYNFQSQLEGRRAKFHPLPRPSVFFMGIIKYIFDRIM